MSVYLCDLDGRYELRIHFYIHVEKMKLCIYNWIKYMHPIKRLLKI